MTSESDFIDGAEGIDQFDPAELDRVMQDLHKDEQEDKDVVRKMLERRRLAYVAVFTAGERTQADIDVVLADLMWFCRARLPTYDIKDGIHAEELSKRKEGRREVFNRIEDFARLDFDALLLMYTNATTK